MQLNGKIHALEAERATEPVCKWSQKENAIERKRAEKTAENYQ
jgi:hypothetical protein